jgi:hypothetical protein
MFFRVMTCRLTESMEVTGLFSRYDNHDRGIHPGAFGIRCTVPRRTEISEGCGNSVEDLSRIYVCIYSVHYSITS